MTDFQIPGSGPGLYYVHGDGGGMLLAHRANQQNGDLGYMHTAEVRILKALAEHVAQACQDELDHRQAKRTLDSREEKPDV